jgi:hypothetical protein
VVGAGGGGGEEAKEGEDERRRPRRERPGEEGRQGMLLLRLLLQWTLVLSLLSWPALPVYFRS